MNTIFVETNSQHMNIQTKKLKLIKDFLQISDETLLDKLERLIQQESKPTASDQMHTLTLEEFRNLVNETILDYENGRTLDQDQLEKDVQAWK